MKIKQKLILSYLAISLLGAIVGLLGIQNIHKVQTGFDRITNQTIPVKNELNNLERTVNDIVACAYEYFYLSEYSHLAKKGQPETVQSFPPSPTINSELRAKQKDVELDYKEYQEVLNRYQTLIDLYFPGEKQHSAVIQASSQKVLKTSKAFMNLEQVPYTDAQVVALQRTFDRARAEFSNAIQSALVHERKELQERQTHLHSTLNTAVQIIFNVSLYNIIFALLVGTFTAISIAKPIEKLKTAAVAIGKGNLESRANALANDELGVLAETFNKMAEDLQQYIAKLQTAKEDNALLATALENVADAIEITDPEAKYLYVNPAFEVITGFTKQEVLGKTPALLRSGKHPPEFYQEMNKTVLQKQIWHGVLVSKRKDGTLYDQEVTLSPILNEVGSLTHVVAVKRDITERKAIERMKDEFISVVSHELRTPLAAIQGGLSLLASGLMSPQSEKGRRVIEIVAESVDRLVLLVNDILEVERLDLGKVPLSQQLCDAAALMLKAQAQVQVMASRAGIILSVMPEPIKFNVDPDRMIQVLTNLLGNAIKFSPRGSMIWFNVELPAGEDYLLFTVKDQGRGIPAQNLETIFERFQQVDASDSRKKGGTGLGLAICRSIVQQHGGRIWAESVLGEGSRFFVAMPKCGSTPA